MPTKEQFWKSFDIDCQGCGQYTHFPIRMTFERLGMGVRDGAFFVCGGCNGRKFVWKTAVLGNVQWEWARKPRNKCA